MNWRHWEFRLLHCLKTNEKKDMSFQVMKMDLPTWVEKGLRILLIRCKYEEDN